MTTARVAIKLNELTTKSGTHPMALLATVPTSLLNLFKISPLGYLDKSNQLTSIILSKISA